MIRRKISYAIAILVLIAAIIVVMSRLLTPVLDKHRAEIETWASAMLDLPVTIKKVHFSWYQYQPEISLDQVVIHRKDNQATLLNIQAIRIFISIPKSLWHFKVIPSSIMLSGADVTVIQKPTGDYALQELPSAPDQTQPNNQAQMTNVLNWVMQLPRLVLNNIDVHFINAAGVKHFITLDNLRLENSSGENHAILGKVILHQVLPTELNFTAKWQGQALSLDKINADIYLFASHVSIPQWLQNKSWQGWQINSGIANTKCWGEWRQGAFQKIQCNFETYGLNLVSTTDKSSHPISRLSGNIGWKREGQAQIFAGDDIFIDLPDHLWPATHFYVALKPDTTGQLKPSVINLGYVDLADVKTFLFSSPPLLPNDYHQWLVDTQLQGEVQNAAVTILSYPMDINHLSLTGDFSQLGFKPWKNLPGFANLTGSVKWDGSEGDLTLHGNQTVVTYNTIFANPLRVEQLTGDIVWQLNQNKNWLIKLDSVQMLDDNLALMAQGTLTVPTNNDPITVDLQSHFTLQNASQVTRYLPLKVFDAGLVTWLNHAFLSGNIDSGKATLRGALKDFPFEEEGQAEKKTGQFLISANVRNLNLNFAPTWPLLKNITAALIFQGRQMRIAATHAEIEGITIPHVDAAIPYLGAAKPAILTVQSDAITTDFAQGLHFIQASPLDKTIGKLFTGTKLTGPVSLTLGLTIPLDHPDTTAVLGNLNFKNAELNLVPWKLVLSQLQGQLQFTEKSTTADNIRGELFKKPVQLKLSTIENASHASIIRATLTNILSINDIEQWLKLPLSPTATGAAHVTTNVDFATDAPIEIHLTSDLVGIALQLPDDYAKPANMARSFSSDITIQSHAPLKVRLNYADLLGAALILENKNDKLNLTAADLHLGKGEASWPANDGLYVTGNLDTLSWEKIKNYQSKSSTSSFTSLPLRTIDLQIQKLVLPGQSLTAARVQLTPMTNGWNMSLSSQEAMGQLQIPNKWTPNSIITGKFQKLNFTFNASSAAVNEFELKSVPALSITADDVTYNKMPLGGVTLKTVPSNTGMTIQSLNIGSPRIDLKSNGELTQTMTHIHGNASSSNVSNLLSSLGFDVHNIVAGKGKLTFDLTWGAPIYALSLASLSGNASIHLGQGRIVELSQTSGAKMDLGRMLSIFSLQTIPRRLNFDFSDVFQKGYSFDLFKGDIKLENGNAFTNDTLFDGPVARVAISGRIGLAAKDYDLTLSVTPYVTSSIPVAATLLTGQPVIGIAAWAVDKVISSGVSNATTYFYVVRGPWSNPTWNSINSPNSQ